jgi:hypothetical protein
MRNTTTRSLSLLVPILTVTGLGTLVGSSDPAPDVEAGALRYEVSITNLTRAQILSPPVVATHNERATPVFVPGKPASPELAGVAEDALNQPLVDKLRGDRNVRDVQIATGVNGPILPGETASVVVQGDPFWFDRLSLVSMLVQTNDAFAGLAGFELPRQGAAESLVVAWDAGSEANTEDCAHIPGPPCNNPMVRVTQGAEGFVRVHEGFHGVGTLAAERYDWRNPVVLVSVRRVF